LEEAVLSPIITRDGEWALIVLPGDPAAKVQVVPVGAGQARVLHWDGFQTRWADWFPDGEHILLTASQSGQTESLYVTDVNGSTPKLLFPGNAGSLVAPDGRSLFDFRNGRWEVRSLEGSGSKPIAGIQAGEFPIAWAAEGRHVFTQAPIATGLTIYKVDVDSGARELWQVVNPKDQIGLRPMNVPTAITPDGRRMVFTYKTQVGQLYRSDTLK